MYITFRAFMALLNVDILLTYIEERFNFILIIFIFFQLSLNLSLI
jgi:hypothetical protein